MRTIFYVPDRPGRGHITRAAALAHRTPDSFVVHHSDWSAPLDWAQVPYERTQRGLIDALKLMGGGNRLMVDGRDFYRMGQCNQQHSADAVDMDAFPTILPRDTEILSRDVARTALGLRADQKALFVVKNTYGDSVSEFADIADGWTVMSDFPYPLAVYLRAADAVIGNSGYNLYWETKLLHVPTFLVPDPAAKDQIRRATPKTLDDARAFFDSLS